MSTITIGLDIAKNVFQVHGEDAQGQVTERKRMGRAALERYFAELPPSLVGIEACGTAHHWGRRLRALGHDVRLIPAAYVKPFVKRNKTDARDAEAICEALRRPSMRFVPIKSVDRQASRALERARDLLVRQATQLRNALRALIAEFGLIAAQGTKGMAELVARLDAPDDPDLPTAVLPALRALRRQAEALDVESAALEARLVARARAEPAMRRLMQVPGIGPLSAHAIVAAIGDGSQFSSARDFAAWAGLTPREHQSASKRRKGKLSRQGDSGLRKLLVLGASALLRQRRAKPERATPWLRGILARRPVKVAVVAQAAKTARIAWAMLRSGQDYRDQGFREAAAA